jgi:hypothetical protein
MSLLPFIIGCINNPDVQEENICKEETLSDAMPLFKIPPVSERIQAYQEILDDNILRIEGDPILRTSTFGELKEHQFKLYLSAVDEPGKEDMKKVYAFTTATLSYWNADTLESKGFAVNDMFGGIPREQIGALYLTPLDRVAFWMNYYPSNASLDINMLIFNIQYDSLEEYIFPLVQRYVCWEAADKLFTENSIQVIKTDNPEEWQRTFLENFLINQLFEFPISGGDVLGKASLHIPGSADEIYRLSIFFLKTSPEGNPESDYTPELEMFMRYRGRIPTLQKDPITDQEAGSMAGHPMIQKFVSTPVGIARVDFLNHASFSNKSSADLALDLDHHPMGLLIRRPPTQQQAGILESMNVNQEAQVSNRLTIYKPDGQYI